MPKYRVELNDGRVFEVEADRQPSEAEIMAHLGGSRSQPAETPAPKPEKSVAGFGANLLSSGGKFLKDTAMGVKDLVVLGSRVAQAQTDPKAAEALSKDFIQLVKSSPEVGKAVFSALKGRYGSGQAILDTLYNDPIGVLADVSTVAGGGAVAAGSKLPRLAKAARTVETATNPLTVPGKAVAKTADLVSDAVITAGVRPPVAIRQDFPGGSRGIAQTIKRERVLNSDGAENKLKDANEKLAQLIDNSDKDMVGDVILEDITQPLTAADGPRRMARERKSLGVEMNGQEKINDRIKALSDTFDPPEQFDQWVKDTIDPLLEPAAVKQLAGNVPPEFHEVIVDQMPSYRPARMKLKDAQRLKQQAQKLAYESGLKTESLDQNINQTIAKAFKNAIERELPDSQALNTRTENLIGAKKALEIAEDRPSGLTNQLSLATALGTTFASGNPYALLSGVAMKTMDNPRMASGLGIGINEVGRALANPTAQRGALASRQAEMIRQALLAALEQQMREGQNER